MRKVGVTTILFLGMMTLSAQDGVAQVRGGARVQANRRPTTSPYLNLLNRGGRQSLAQNYFRRVQPEMEFRRNNARLSRSVLRLQTQVARQRSELPPRLIRLGTTGHTTTFNSVSRYFPASRGR